MSWFLNFDDFDVLAILERDFHFRINLDSPFKFNFDRFQNLALLAITFSAVFVFKTKQILNLRKVKLFDQDSR